jgi:predicted phage terminase large subunit-like protein
MAALMYVDYPDYNAIIFRRTFTDLSLPSALMDVSKQWLTDTPARWNELKKVWFFPSGATISFGYLDNVNAKYRYQGSEFHFVAMDEVSQIDKLSYLYLFSRIRKQAKDSEIPLRMFSASNPPQTDAGMWVYERFINESTPRHHLDPETKKEYVHFFEKEDKDGKRAFVPALLGDNPYIHDSYLDSLARLDWVSREQLLYGHWLVRADGGVFKKEWLSQWYDPSDPPQFEETVISVDMAFKDTVGADFTVFQCWGRNKANYYLIDQVRDKWIYPKAKQEFKKFCDRHPTTLRKLIEDAAAGQSLIQDLRDDVPGIIAFKPGNKSKLERASMVSPLFEARQVYLPTHRSWTDDFVSELVAFTGAKGGTDDCVDAMSQALARMKRHRQEFFVGSF